MIRALNCRLLLALALGAGITGACDPKDFSGSYGFLLTGTTTIGGEERPVTIVGRITLDGWGTIRSTSSAAFTGIVLGNPATGSYEADRDCAVRWAMRDDSATWQHFAGMMSDRGARVVFRQTDPGGVGNGLMLRTSDYCPASSLQGRFDLTLSGNTVDVDSGRAFGRVSFAGLIQADGAGGLSFATGAGSATVKAGSYDFEDGCFVRVSVPPVGGNRTNEMHFRGILVDNGSTLFGMQTDPGAVVTLRLSRSESRPDQQ